MTTDNNRIMFENDSLTSYLHGKLHNKGTRCDASKEKIKEFMESVMDLEKELMVLEREKMKKEGSGK